MGTAKRVVKNTGFLYAKMGITMFISLYTTRLVLNALGVSDFGIFNIVGGAIGMLGFLNASMASATQRFMSYAEGEGNKEKQKKIFNISVVLHFFIALVLGLVLLIIGYFFFNGILNIEADRIFAAKVIYGSLILSTMFTVMSVPYDAVLNARENMLYYAIVGIVESLLKLFVALAVVYMAGDKLILYGTLMACIPFLIMTIMRVYCHKKYEECMIAPRKYWDKDLMKEISGFAGWSFFTSAATMITMQGTAILLNIFFGVIANAAHGIANQLAGQVMVFSNNMLKALNPTIVKSEGAKHRDKMLEITVSGSKLSFMLLALFALPLCLETPFFLSIWLKAPPEYAILFCRLVLIRLMITQLHVPLVTAINAGGKIKAQSVSISLITLLVLPTSAFLYYLEAPIYMVYVVLIIMTIAYLIVNAYFMHVKYNFNLSFFFSQVTSRCIFSGVLTAMIGLVIMHLFEPTIYRFLLVTGICMVFFLVFFYFLALNKIERNIILSIRNKIIRR
jgi:O-antigen/teichoic acid export membrane protein